MKYDVHLYTVVRVKIENVEAESYEKAIDKAEADFLENPRSTIRVGLVTGEAEYAEEIVGALVDVVGDEDYGLTAYFQPDADGNYKQQAPEGSGRG